MKSKKKLTIQLPPSILEALLVLNAHVEAAYQFALRSGTPEPWTPDPPLSIADKLRVIEAYSARMPNDQRELLRACCEATRDVLRRYDEFVSLYSPVVVGYPPMDAVIDVTGLLETLNAAWKLILHGDRASGGVSVRIWSSSPPVLLVKRWYPQLRLGARAELPLAREAGHRQTPV